METTTSKLQFEVAEIQLSYKSKVKPSLRPKINSSREAYEVLLQTWDEDKFELIEQFKILIMNRGNRVLGVFEVSTGGGGSTIVDPKVVFAAAIKSNATSIILAHNHPSGALSASEADCRLTRRLSEAGRLLDIPVLDHIIVSCEGYLSFADEGLL